MGGPELRARWNEIPDLLADIVMHGVIPSHGVHIDTLFALCDAVWMVELEDVITRTQDR